MKTLVATFHTPEALMRAAEKTKAEGFPPEDALTPFPIDGIDGVLGLKQANIRRRMAFAGFSAAAFAYALEWYSAAIAYPYNSGGRPFNSWPVFLLFPFELGVLVAGITGFIALSDPLRPAEPSSSAFRCSRYRKSHVRSLLPGRRNGEGRKRGKPAARAS